ncbi:hypothetical protein SEA_HIRKO_54 [Arthrobacter phage Hirko]|nr:hypothetical protein SEA_HIRKO_54 [Arthrobacter phage Hirko]
MPKRGPWRLDHNPFARPLGCNGAYGVSGARRHRRQGTATCAACLASEAHYQREYRRGQPKPKALKPCGTWAAAQRHRVKGERLDMACVAAESEYKQALRERADAA